MDKDRIEGSAKQIKGSIKEAAGKVTGDSKLEAEGKADKAAGKKVRLVAAEPSSCPSLTKGVYAYDFGDVSGYTPLMKMYTLGHDFMPPSIHAGGLRYHGDSLLVCQLYNEGLIEAVAVPDMMKGTSASRAASASIRSAETPGSTKIAIVVICSSSQSSW